MGEWNNKELTHGGLAHNLAQLGKATNCSGQAKRKQERD